MLGRASNSSNYGLRLFTVHQPVSATDIIYNQSIMFACTKAARCVFLQTHSLHSDDEEDNLA